MSSSVEDSLSKWVLLVALETITTWSVVGDRGEGICIFEREVGVDGNLGRGGGGGGGGGGGRSTGGWVVVTTVTLCPREDRLWEGGETSPPLSLPTIVTNVELLSFVDSGDFRPATKQKKN